MLRFPLVMLAFMTGPLLAQPGDYSPALNGCVEGRTYISPTGTYRIPIPVLAELGGTVTDTPNVVIFKDNFNVHVSIGTFPQDATQRWELSTRGLKDYLVYFFSTFVLPDFGQVSPDCRVESAKFSPGIMDGSLITYLLLPGGSMFGEKHAILGINDKPLVAKRGNLLFARNGYIYIVSMELAERVVEGGSYQKTTAQEDEILRQRLTDIALKMEFNRPASRP